MKSIIIISFSLIGFFARSQSPQAKRLFNFDFKKELITIDTVMKFEGLSKNQIIKDYVPYSVPLKIKRHLHLYVSTSLLMWRRADSNRRPLDCQSSTLAN